MPLEPQIKAILDQAAAAKAPPLSSMSPGQARDEFLVRCWNRLAGLRQPWPESEDRAIDGPAGQIKLRVYTPEGKAPFPVLVFFHGGGWVLGDLESHDALCRALTHEARCVTAAGLITGARRSTSFPPPPKIVTLPHCGWRTMAGC